MNTPKRSFLIVSLITLITSICGTAEAKALYAGGSNPDVVYRYLGWAVVLWTGYIF